MFGQFRTLRLFRWSHTSDMFWRPQASNKDCKGKLVTLQTKLLPTMTPYLAELNALFWASEMAMSLPCSSLVWECDANNVIRDVLDPKDPCVWESRHDLLVVKSRFRTSPWTIHCEARSANGLADDAAKFLFCLQLFYALMRILSGICLTLFFLLCSMIMTLCNAL